MTLQMLPREEFSAWRDVLPDARAAMEAAGFNLRDVYAVNYAIAILRRHRREDWPHILYDVLPKTAPEWFK